MNDIKITVRMLFNDGGMCVDGQIAFCKKHNIDFKNILKNGIMLSELEKIEDGMVQRYVKKVKQNGR